MGLDKIDHTLPCHPLLHLSVYLCSIMHFPSKSLHACIHIDASRWSCLCPSESYVQDLGFFPYTSDICAIPSDFLWFVNT